MFAIESVARSTWPARSPLTESSTSGFWPGASRVRPVGWTVCVETLPRSFPSGIPLAREAVRSVASERATWLTIVGFVPRLGTETFPVGENGCPR